MEFRAEFAPEDTISDGLVGLDCRFCHSARSLNKGLVAKPSRSRPRIGHWIDPEPINPDRGRSRGHSRPPPPEVWITMQSPGSTMVSPLPLIGLPDWRKTRPLALSPPPERPRGAYFSRSVSIDTVIGSDEMFFTHTSCPKPPRWRPRPAEFPLSQIPRSQDRRALLSDLARRFTNCGGETHSRQSVAVISRAHAARQIQRHDEAAIR